jgi:hypothetical protein
MTQAVIHRATGLGPEWHVIWEGRHALPDVEHLCGGPYGRGGTYVSEYMRLGYEATGGPGREGMRVRHRKG